MPRARGGRGGPGDRARAVGAREEAALDLFTEQAIWPAVFAVMEAAYEVLAPAGFSDDAILDEIYLSGEPAEVFARIAAMGLLDQLPTHSRTSQFGQLTNVTRSGELVETLRARFTDVLHGQILSGRFAAEWTEAGADAEKTLGSLRDAARSHPLLRAEHAVRERRPPAVAGGQE